MEKSWAYQSYIPTWSSYKDVTTQTNMATMATIYLKFLTIAGQNTKKTGQKSKQTFWLENKFLVVDAIM